MIAKTEKDKDEPVYKYYYGKFVKIGTIKTENK